LKKRDTQYIFKSKSNIIDVFDCILDVMVQSQKRVSQRQEEKEKKRTERKLIHLMSPQLIKQN